MTIRVLAWNVGEPPRDALPGFADAIRAVNPDIVLLNEAMRDGPVTRFVTALGRFIAYGPDQVGTLARMCGYPYSAAADTASFFWGLMGYKVNGVLSRFPLSGQRSLGAIVDPDEGRYDALEVQVNVNGRIWHVFSLRFTVHDLPNFTTHCAMLRDRILQLPPGTPVIAGGDFNGNGHNEGLLRGNPLDPAIVQRLPPPMRDLMDRTNLRSVTSDLPLRIDPTRSDYPPFLEATDMIFYRGPVRHANTVLLLPPLPDGCAEAHGYVWSDLLDEPIPTPNPSPPPITPPPFLPAPQPPFVNLQLVLTSDPKDEIRADVTLNTSLSFVMFELVSDPATLRRKELLIMRPGKPPLTLFTYSSRRADSATITVFDVPGTRVVLRKQIDGWGAMRTVADVLIDAVTPRSTIKLTWKRD